MDDIQEIVAKRLFERYGNKRPAFTWDGRWETISYVERRRWMHYAGQILHLVPSNTLPSHQLPRRIHL